MQISLSGDSSLYPLSVYGATSVFAILLDFIVGSRWHRSKYCIAARSMSPRHPGKRALEFIESKGYRVTAKPSSPIC